MKMTRSFLTLIFALTALSVSAQDISFNVQITTPKKAEPMTIKVATSGSKMVMQPQMGPQGAMRIIVDNAAKTQFLLMENNGQKMAMQVDAYDPATATSKVQNPKVTVTKETKTIDGMVCTKVIAETEENISTLWVTRDAGLSYQDLAKVINSSRGTPGSREMLPALEGVSGFPIEIVSKNKAKDEPVVMNIKNISRGKVDQALFSMDGYKVSDMRKVK